MVFDTLAPRLDQRSKRMFTKIPPTRHWSENGPTEGYVYLAVRDRTDHSVKIGSTRTTPAERLARTPSCTQAGFLVACATTSARELEYHLQVQFTEAGKSLHDREHFNLNIYDILRVALWFNSSTFVTQDGQDRHIMTLVNQHGQPPSTLDEMVLLIGDAVSRAEYADSIRCLTARYAERQRRAELMDDWSERTAERWTMDRNTFKMLVLTGELSDQIKRANEYIDQGRRPPTSPKPAHLRGELD